MVIAVAWAKQEGLTKKDAVWYKMKRPKWTVLERNGAKLFWDFEYYMQKLNEVKWIRVLNFLREGQDF
jgi:hypothetical protein